MMTDDPSEPVHSVLDYYDGPLSGVADFGGKPHGFDTEEIDWDSGDRVFRLSPLTEQVFRATTEAWAIWRRWEAAFHEGRTTLETHPALPEDRLRKDELDRFLQTRLVHGDRRVVRARGEFGPCPTSTWNGYGMKPLRVRWTVVE